MSEARPGLLILDTSVAVKWYLTEELDDQAARLLEATESGAIEFSAPSTIQPEYFNALWQRRRRGELTLEEVRRGWGDFASDDPTTLYAPEDLMPRAAEIASRAARLSTMRCFLRSPKTQERSWSPPTQNS